MPPMPSRFSGRTMPFGKYKNCQIFEIGHHDPQYLTWFASLPKVRSNSRLWPIVRDVLILVLINDSGFDLA